MSGGSLRQVGGLTYFSFGLLEDQPGLVQAVFTRHGGVSAAPFATLNAGRSVGDDPDAVTENRRRTAEALGLDPADFQGSAQVHGSRVALVVGRGGTAEGGGGISVVVEQSSESLPEADALITARRGVFLALRFADCVPVMLYDPVHAAVGLAHAGWRGTAEAVAVAAVRAMGQAFGTRPGDLLAGIGPSIGPCCYEVSRGLVDVFRPRFAWWHEVVGDRGGRLRLDLWQANRRQLAGAGVPDEQIETAGICTSCRTEDFFSHRAEGGRTGRFSGILGMRK